MTDSQQNLPEHVLVYGGDHSPWVQAVLLGLHEKKVAHTVVTAPPLQLFRNSGVLMPAACIDGAPWMLQSQDILCELGFQRISDEDMLAMFRALRGGMHRIDSGLRFWYEWSLVRDRHSNPFVRLKNYLVRPFAVLYFHMALNRLAKNAKASPSPEAMRRQYLYWVYELEKSTGSFIDGDAPGTRDFMLFGGIQCHASIKVPPIPVLQSDPELARLRDWIAAMHERFVDYEHLYSGLYFEPKRAAPKSSSLFAQFIFWLGSAITLVAAPITMPLARHYFRRVRKLGMLPIPSSRPAPTQGH